MSGFLNENKLIASLTLIVAMLVVRTLLGRLLEKKAGDDAELAKHWANTLNNTTQLLIVLGLMIVWVTELRYAALSVAAFIVAIVIATREFIQNFLGALYIASSRPFSIGDWVSIDNHVGEVVRSDWLTTTMLEIDVEDKSYAYSGRTLVVPNNQFVTKTTLNLNYMRRYISHSFALVRDPDEINLFDAKDMILAKAEDYCRSFSDVAERYNSRIETRMGVAIPGPKASVRISTSILGKNVFTVSIFCPTEEVVNIEQKVTEDFMAYWYAASKKAKSKKPEARISRRLNQQDGL